MQARASKMASSKVPVLRSSPKGCAVTDKQMPSSQVTPWLHCFVRATEKQTRPLSTALKQMIANRKGE